MEIVVPVRRIVRHQHMVSAKLAFLAVALSSCLPAAGLDDAARSLSGGVFRELIEVNTTDSGGSATVPAQAMAKRLVDAGFPQADVQVLGPNDRKGNLVARLRGTGTGGLKPILLRSEEHTSE